MNVQIRQAATDDVASILELYRHLLSHDDPAPEFEKLRRIWSSFVSNPAMTCLVAEIESKAIGTCTIIIVPNLTRGGRPYALIENVVVHSNYQKKGIGRQMIEHAIEMARQANCYKIMLLSGADNKNHAFYERLGFDRHRKVGFELRIPRG
jgi:GNAT superfamily N-acetyltransferase